jgi:hypothetical protein
VHVFRLLRMLKFGAVHGLWCRPALLSSGVGRPNQYEPRLLQRSELGRWLRLRYATYGVPTEKRDPAGSGQSSLTRLFR